MGFRSFLQEGILDTTNIFCDMDGTLCDWIAQADKMMGKKYSGTIPDAEKKRIFAVGESLEFWVDMPWTPGGRQLWNFIKPYNPLILTAGDDLDPASNAGKYIWAQKNLGLPKNRVIITTGSQFKPILAKPGRILIDDYPSNISQWESKGGTGVLYKGATYAIEKLKTALDEGYNTYLEGLNRLSDRSLTESFLVDLGHDLSNFLKQAKTVLEKIASGFGVSFAILVNAFRSYDVFMILKAFKFNLGMIVKSLIELDGLVQDGLLLVFQELLKTDALSNVRKGLDTVDRITQAHPILKRMTGLAIAALLLFMKLNYKSTGTTFSQEANSYVTIAKAISGQLSLADALLSPARLQAIVTTLIGTGTGFKLPWLAYRAMNIVIALIFLGYRNREKLVPEAQLLLTKIRNLRHA